MGVTIRDVAERAGVSASTVSLVLNGKAGIGAQTRELVFRIAKELEYPIPLPGKRDKPGGTIGFLKMTKHGHVINRHHNVFISDYIEGLEKEARAYGWGLEVRNYSVLDRDEILRDLKDSALEGLVVLATELNDPDIRLFEEISLPLVFLDASLPASPFDFVDMDNEGAVYSIIGELKQKGHTRIGLVTSSLETRNFRLRERSFRDALGHYGLPYEKSWIYRVDSTFEQASVDMERGLDEGRKLPTAFFCVCDMIAFGCMKALKKKGFSIPRDCSVVGFDDLPSSSLSDPPLASVAVSKKRIGRRAFQLLRRRMENGMGLPHEKVFIGSEFVLRESLGAAPDREAPPGAESPHPLASKKGVIT